MKKLVSLVGLVAVLLTLAVLTLKADTITFRWDASPAAQQVTSYKVYSGTNGSPVQYIATVTTNEYTQVVTNTGVYSFAVKAVNLAGESGLSLIVATPPAPATPSNPTVTVTP